jgi:hypothetical protein
MNASLVKLEWLAGLPSLQRQAYFEREGKGGESGIFRGFLRPQD